MPRVRTARRSSAVAGPHARRFVAPPVVECGQQVSRLGSSDLLLFEQLEHAQALGVALIAFRRGDVLLPPTDPNMLASYVSQVGPFSARFFGDLLLVGSAATWALFSSVGRPLVASVGAFHAILQASVVAIVILAPFVPIELAGGSRGRPQVRVVD